MYDVLGREVRTLVNEELKAGSYETTFDATGLASGVYFYRLQVSSFIQTKKLILAR
ncbi:MAG: T9SS type A sorting domain-containing protein [Bacteroidota bacterium]